MKTVKLTCHVHCLRVMSFSHYALRGCAAILMISSVPMKLLTLYLEPFAIAGVELK